MTRQTSELTDNGIDTLRQELTTLREDVGKLVHTVVDMSKQGASSAKHRTHEEIEHRLAQLETAYHEARKRGDQAVESTRHTVETHPLSSIALAFGIGALIGRVLRHA